MTGVGRVAFITGSGRGIGKALALGFSRNSYQVVVASTTAANNDAVTSEIEADGGEALSIPLDVSQEDQVKRAFAQAVARFGRVDVLINNAGLKGGHMPPDGRMLKDGPFANFWRIFEVNVAGAFLCSREAAQLMVEQGRGSIINISSGARPGDGPYSASKAALNALTLTMAAELKDQNVAVNAIYPGATQLERPSTFRPASASQPKRVKIDTTLPLALYWAAQDPIDETGQIVDALAWNEAHGLGGWERWGATPVAAS